MRGDLKQLTTFVVVAETGNLLRASERLHLTQAALSMQLKSLQEAHGISLFKRTGRGLSLTEEGERLLPHARAVVCATEVFESAAGALTNATAQDATAVSIGTILDPTFVRLGALLQAMSTRLPRGHTELRHGISGWVKKEVRAGRLDFGFYLGDIDPDVFKQLRLARLRYIVIGPRGWGSRMEGDWRSLARMPWVWTPPESVHCRLLNPLFRSLKMKPNIVASVDQEASMLDLVRASVGLSLAREDIAIKEAHVSGLAVSRHLFLETDLSVIALHERASDPTVTALFEAANSVWSPF